MMWFSVLSFQKYSVLANFEVIHTVAVLILFPFVWNYNYYSEHVQLVVLSLVIVYMFDNDLALVFIRLSGVTLC